MEGEDYTLEWGVERHLVLSCGRKIGSWLAPSIPPFFFLFSFPYKSRPPPSRFSKTGVEAYPPPVYTDLIVVSPHPPDDVAVRAVALAAVRTPPPHLEYAAVASGVVSDAAAI